MALATRFRRLLDEAVARRTDRLRRLILPAGQGAPKRLSRKIRDGLKSRLLTAASEVLVQKRAKREFGKVVLYRYRRHIRGHGARDRFTRLYRWAKAKFDGPIVYSFWKAKRCLYVGKGGSYRRLNSYQNNLFLKEADSLVVWAIRTKNRLPQAEGLAIHLFHPRQNKVKPARVKWGRTCPICKIHDDFHQEISQLLNLK